MDNFEGKVAVVTGGGSGIGEGMARAFHERGMRVVVADVDTANAERVAADLGAMAVRTDVSDLGSVQELADRAYDAYGEVHVLCNNAGVAPVGPISELTEADWRWGLGVNLDGIVHGLLAFLPRMHDQAGPGHVVNTASMAGVTAIRNHAIYCASKHAAVAMTEVIRAEGAAHGVSASVLCPGMVRTGILDSARNRPAHLSGGSVVPLGMRNALMRRAIRRLLLAAARDPLEVGRTVVRSVERDDLYIFTHRTRTYRRSVAARQARVEAAFT